jgi:cytosine/adenosine deaminase-related metal-dependent hydrolase
VTVSGNRIEAVGRWRDISAHSGRVVDLGEVILMPGLVNAHCHLDYTHMAGQLSSPKLFIDWLKLITATKSQWSTAEYSASWLNGAQMLVRTGTSTVADIEAVPELLPEVWNATPLRVISLLEMIGITKRRPPEAVLREALEKIDALEHRRCFAGLSPHAPYSTVAPLLKSSADVSRRKGWLLCTHVAESQTEFDMFSEARGDMFEWLRRSGREMSDCGFGSPIRHLERCGMLQKNLIVTHANYLARGDATLLARCHASVVHCPRSHEFFRHETFPLARLLRAGVNVCLGTDSLASVNKPRRQAIELDMFAEMRLLANKHPSLSSRAILQMATINGARALARPGLIGELSNGGMPDIIALPFSRKEGHATDAVLEHRAPLAASMIDGRWALPPS